MGWTAVLKLSARQLNCMQKYKPPYSVLGCFRPFNTGDLRVCYSAKINEY